jgi:hypothetical protein
MFFSECFSREKLVNALILYEISQHIIHYCFLKKVHLLNYFKKFHYIINRLRFSCVINKFFELTLYHGEFCFG